MIPFKRINLGKSYEMVKPLFETGYIGLGSVVEEFEKELAESVGSKFVVTTDSCTSALFLSLKYEGLFSLREVSIPSMTVPLVANACIEAGISIKFNGATDWVGSSYKLIGSHIYDSAHELHRDQYKTLRKKDHDAKLCFSFYPTKTIGSADGGAIATNDRIFYEWAKSCSTYGRDMSQSGNSWDYDVMQLGYKRHYTNLQAAICLEQLRRLDETTERRQRIVSIYNNALGYDNKSDYLYRINVPERNKFIEYAKDNGVECGVHFKPLHLMTPFKDIEMSKEDREKVEEAYDKTVSLPFFDTMTDEEINKVIEVVKSYENLHSTSRG
jgi:dTDP-4-amino-4,6-dideoxygalactose transaminase